MTQTEERQAEEVSRLAIRAANLTQAILESQARATQFAKERADAWKAALDAGATHAELARTAGVHARQISKALERYARAGSAPS